MQRSQKFTKPINLMTAWFGLMLGIMVVIPGTFSVFFDHIAAEFAWKRAEISLAFSLFILASTLVLPFVGRLVDRFGARKIIIPAILTFMAGMLSFRFLVDGLWLYYLTFLVIGVAASGTSTLTYFKVITQSFTNRRGLALGIANSGTGVGALVFPVIGFWLVDNFGWRDAYLFLGIAITLVSIPIVLAGLDDEFIDKPAHMPATDRQGSGITLAEALRSRAFWIIGTAFLCGATTLIGFLVHMVPLLTDRGVSPRTAAIAASTFGVAQLVGRLVAGWLLDKYPAAFIAAGIWIISTVIFLLIGAGAGGTALLVCTAALGLAWGSEGDILAFFVARYFGLAFFGAIYGSLLTMHLIGGVIGPYLLGLGFDSFGSYTLTLFCMAAVTTFASILIFFVGPPAVTADGNRI